MWKMLRRHINYLKVKQEMPKENICLPLRITQHKGFVPDATHPNFYFAKTSFMLKTLGETASLIERGYNEQSKSKFQN